MKFSFALVSTILIPLLITSPVKAAMQSPAAEVSSSLQLRIELADRDGESVPAGSESSKGYAVRVLDSTGNPAADNAVVFRLPDEGPSGTFADGTHSAIVYTSPDGLARVAGIKWGETAGSVAIKVTATRGDARAGTLLRQLLTTSTNVMVEHSVPQPGATAAPMNTPPVTARVSEIKKPAAPTSPLEPVVSVVNSKTTEKSYHGSHKKWIILAAVVAAGAGAGLALGSKKKTAASSTSTTGVSIGPPTVSVGQP